MANERGEMGGMGEHIGPRSQARHSGGNWRLNACCVLMAAARAGLRSIAFLERNRRKRCAFPLPTILLLVGYHPAEFRLCHYFMRSAACWSAPSSRTMLSSGMSAREIRDLSAWFNLFFCL